MSIPTFDAFNSLFTTEENCLQILLEQGCLYTDRTCPNCSSVMKLHMERRHFRCHKRTCRIELSILKNSFFSLSHLPPTRILRLAWLWLNKVSITSAISMAGNSSHTVAAFYGFFRQLVGASLEEDDLVIGGDGVIVEIDESKFGKRKYNRGHRVEGVWVFGGVERTPEKRTFLTVVADRTSRTLLEVLRTRLLPGTIVYSDCWKSYNGITDILGLEHFTVNHSLGFVNGADGTHTNTIEGVWNGIKIRVPSRNRTKNGIPGHLMEYIWRKRNKDRLWTAFFEAMAKIHYD